MIDIYNYFFEIPLYQKFEIPEDQIQVLEDFFTFNDKIDAYNPNLKENTTYNIRTFPVKKGFAAFTSYSGYYTHTITCVRTREEYQAYSYFDGKTRILRKIGQYASIADFHISQIKKYDSVLSKEKLKEFTRAIGLAANGVGIGSFVYLRRIFESLLEDAHLKAKSEEGWNDEEFRTSRVAEKIELLHNHLPNFLVDNKELYGILSKGIHSLDENECLAYYETVKVGIEIILDEKLEEIEKARKIEKAQKRIASLNSKLK